MVFMDVITLSKPNNTKEQALLIIMDQGVLMNLETKGLPQHKTPLKQKEQITTQILMLHL